MSANSRFADSQLRVLTESRQTTLAALDMVDDSSLLHLSHLTLPEIQSIKQEISQVLPAGNLPAFVLSGLLKLKGRVIGSGQVSQDLSALMRGASLIPQSLYGLFVAGPATVLYAYQKILQLAGKDLSTAFPQGTWQFYLQFGLREDSARHTNEALGFHKTIIAQPDATMAAAWVCAALELLYAYDDLLALDWSERVMLRLIMDEATQAGLAERKPFDKLVADWNKARPYHRPRAAGDADYVTHRQSVFSRFAQERLKALPGKARSAVQKSLEERRANELAAFQEQMTLLATLEPDRYEEHKRPIPLWQARLGFVWQGHTFLLPVCRQDERGSPLCFPSQGSGDPIPLYASSALNTTALNTTALGTTALSTTALSTTALGTTQGGLCDAERRPLVADRCWRVYYQQNGQLMGQLRPPLIETVLGWTTAILSMPLGAAPNLDWMLAASPRSSQAALRKELPPATQAELAALRYAPIIINWDGASRALPLAYIRRSHRGIGDHALTIFRTDSSFVFDQSHIFFDGMWGLAVAEILTDSAIHWYRRAAKARAVEAPVPAPLVLSVPAKVQASINAQAHRGETSAESNDVDTKQLLKLRQWLGQRGVRLTVNDVLLLYRFFHAMRYEPSRLARQAVQELQSRSHTPQVKAALESITATLARYTRMNPALLIPMDGSNVSPRERVFPTTFRNPLTEIQDRFATAFQSYHDYLAHPKRENWPAFDQARRELLAYLKAFGELLDALKAVTMRGESFNTATIRLLGHLPPTMQHLLDQVPQHIGVLNEIIKGSEVFSNVGRVAPGASLSRFISAKDDGESKELVWGMLTDDEGKLHISLRDFRPFVPLLMAMRETALADLLVQDYLESYVRGLNEFVAQLSGIITVQGR